MEDLMAIDIIDTKDADPLALYLLLKKLEEHGYHAVTSMSVGRSHRYISIESNNNHRHKTIMFLDDDSDMTNPDAVYHHIFADDSISVKFKVEDLVEFVDEMSHSNTKYYNVRICLEKIGTMKVPYNYSIG